MTERELKEAAAKIILHNRECHRIPHSVMESIVLGTNSLFQTAMTEVHHQVVAKMKEADVDPSIITSVCTVFDSETQYTNVFKGLETTHLQNTFIKKNFRFVVCHIKNIYRYYRLSLFNFACFAGACS